MESKKVRAVRNLRLCSKDCLCLYVCPTGATDTETGQVDFQKCIGCGACAKACPAGAISMVPYQYPKQQVKDEKVMQSLNNIFKSKTDQENIAYRLYEKSSSQVEKQFLKALIRSNRLLAEDTIREAGYMLPQSKNTNAFLKSLLDNSDEEFPKDAVNELLELLECNE